jgi:Peptidase family M48
MTSKVNSNHLPSGTNVYFLVIIITSLMVAFWSGQFLPTIGYFTTPFNSPMQPGIYSTEYGLFGVLLCFVLAFLLFIYHTRSQQRVFGSFVTVTPQAVLWETINSLADPMDVRIGKILLDNDIRNTDAVAFGFMKSRTILLGKGLLLMSVARPADFSARIAHELGHFKNGDVKYAFISRALVQANLILMSAVVVWILFEPLLVIIMNYNLFTSPLGNLPGASPELFFKLHGLRWLAFWFNRVTGSIIMTVPVFVFWTLLLFGEYRALLRTRELLADAQAARWAGDGALLDTLNRGIGKSSPSLLWRFYQLFSAHPTVQERIKSIYTPEEVLKPSLLRFVFLGYLYSLATFLVANAEIMISIMSPDYDKLYRLADPMAVMIELVNSSSRAISLLYIGMFVLSIITFFIIISTILRSCISARVLKYSTPRWIFVTLLQVGCVAVGITLGNFVHPYSQADQAGIASNAMLEKVFNTIFVIQVNTSFLPNVLNRSMILVATALVFWVATFFISRGNRVRPVRSVEWGLLMLSTVAFVYQVYGILSLPLTHSELQRPEFYIPGAIVGSVYLLIIVVIVRVIRGKMRYQETEFGCPPWMVAA